jgi:hypothetical protein
MTIVEWENASDQKRAECGNTLEIATPADARALPDGITLGRDKTSERHQISDSKK